MLGLSQTAMEIHPWTTVNSSNVLLHSLARLHGPYSADKDDKEAKVGCFPACCDKSRRVASCSQKLLGAVGSAVGPTFLSRNIYIATERTYQ